MSGAALIAMQSYIQIYQRFQIAPLGTPSNLEMSSGSLMLAGHCNGDHGDDDHGDEEDAGEGESSNAGTTYTS